MVRPPVVWPRVVWPRVGCHPASSPGHQTRPRGHESQSECTLPGPAQTQSSAPPLPPPTLRSVCQKVGRQPVGAARGSAVLPSSAGLAPSGQRRRRRRLQRRQRSPSGRRGVGRAAAAELLVQRAAAAARPEMVRGRCSTWAALSNLLHRRGLPRRRVGECPRPARAARPPAGPPPASRGAVRRRPLTRDPNREPGPDPSRAAPPSAHRGSLAGPGGSRWGVTRGSSRAGPSRGPEGGEGVGGGSRDPGTQAPSGP
nr:dapper homolog 3-like [Camelus dromedarius]